MPPSRSETVPKQLQPLFEDLTGRTDAFCREYLDEEYVQLCRQMAAALCRKRPSPLLRGKVDTWACAVAYAVGSVNFLFDKSQTQHMRAADLCKRFGVSQSTASARVKTIRDALGIGPYDPDWCLPSKLGEHPLAWFIQVDGLIVDARQAPRDIQEEAFRLGLIPYVPEEGSALKKDDLAVLEGPKKGGRLGGQEPRYNYFLNPYPDVRFTSCPRCEGKTGQRKLPLVIHIEGSLLLSLNMTCRFCPSCDLLIVHQDDLEDLLTAICLERDPQIIGNEYLVLETVDRPVWRRGVNGELTPREILDNMHDFREAWDFQPTPLWEPSPAR